MQKLLIVASTAPPTKTDLYYECLDYHVNRYIHYMNVKPRSEWTLADRKAETMLKILHDRILGRENLYSLNREFGYHMKMMIDLGHTSLVVERRKYLETFRDLDGGERYDIGQ